MLTLLRDAFLLNIIPGNALTSLIVLRNSRFPKNGRQNEGYSKNDLFICSTFLYIIVFIVDSVRGPDVV